MDGRDLWSPGQETIVFVTLLICPYDSSFVLPGIHVVPLTCTLEAQTAPELNSLKVKRGFTWRDGRCPTLRPHGSLISPNNSCKIITRSFAWLDRGSHGGRAGDGGGNHLNMEAQGSLQNPWTHGPWHIPFWRVQ